MSFYSLSYLIAPLAYLLTFNLAKSKFDLDDEDKYSLFFLSIFASILGGRLGYIIIYDFSFYIHNPLEVFKIWYGGMSFHGALFLNIILLYLYSLKKKYSFFSLSSLFSLYGAFGIFFGRIANFYNDELYGLKYNGILSLAIIQNGELIYRFPSQILEAFLEGFVLFFIILVSLMREKSHKIISFYFLFFYSIFRIFSEFFREPDYHIGYIYSYLTMGMILSIITLIMSLLVIKLKGTSN